MFFYKTKTYVDSQNINIYNSSNVYLTSIIIKVGYCYENQ